MKQRHNSGNKNAAPAKQPPTPPKEEQPKDDLGITRGQNAEKGTTDRPENIYKRDRASH